MLAAKEALTSPNRVFSKPNRFTGFINLREEHSRSGVLRLHFLEHTMTMKIRQEDLLALRNAVQPFDTVERRAAYAAGNFPRAELCKNRDMRYRWDLLYMSRLRIGDGAGMDGDLNLYSYLDDTHIDSALRSFIPALAA
ncbi:hypothetical protein LJR129_005036 [Acidovorax sp. LjRoot129]